MPAIVTPAVDEWSVGVAVGVNETVAFCVGRGVGYACVGAHVGVGGDVLDGGGVGVGANVPADAAAAGADARLAAANAREPRARRPRPTADIAASSARRPRRPPIKTRARSRPPAARR